MILMRRLLIAFVFTGAALAFAETTARPAEPMSAAAAAPERMNERWMVEGEKRYRTNCGRCHQAPHKFPPRAMAMAVRHMRVRALLTDDDMKYILYYTTH